MQQADNLFRLIVVTPAQISLHRNRAGRGKLRFRHGRLRSYAMKSARLKWPAAYGLARSDDDGMVACIGRAVVVIDMRTRSRLMACRPLPHPSSGCFSPNGELLAIKSTSGRIVTINPGTGDIMADFKNQREGEGCGVSFSPDGNALIDGSWAGQLTVRDSTDGEITFRQSYDGDMLSRISHDRERRRWLVEHSPKVKPDENQTSPAYLSFHDWPFSAGEAHIFSFDMHIETAQISPDGTRFCFFQKWNDRRVHVARVSDGQIIASSAPMTGGGTGSDLAWSSDSKHIAAVADGQFVFMKASDLTITGAKTMDYPSSALFTQNDSELILGSWNTSVSARCDQLMKD